MGPVTVYRLPIRLPAKSAADLAGSLIGSLQTVTGPTADPPRPPISKAGLTQQYCHLQHVSQGHGRPTCRWSCWLRARSAAFFPELEKNAMYGMYLVRTFQAFSTRPRHASKHTLPRLARSTLNDLQQNRYEKASLVCVGVQSPSGLALVPCALSMVDLSG